MRKMRKRIISGLLAAVMAITALPELNREESQ